MLVAPQRGAPEKHRKAVGEKARPAVVEVEQRRVGPVARSPSARDATPPRNPGGTERVETRDQRTSQRMSAPLTASVPHRLGKDEALRRLKTGLERAHGQFGALFTIEQEEWSGDTLSFRMHALGQTASGTITVKEDSVQITVVLPTLLAWAAQRILPALRQQTTLLLEKK